MITALVIACLIISGFGVFWLTDRTQPRPEHISYGLAIVLASALMVNVVWVVVWPAMLSVECSWLGYCDVGLNDLWVQVWLTLAFVPGLFVGIVIVLCTTPDNWAKSYCCEGMAHPSRTEMKQWAVRREKQRERLASIGFTEKEFIGILRDAIFVAKELGERDARRAVHPHFGAPFYVYGYQDDRIKVSLETGDAVLVETMHEGEWLKVLDSVHPVNPEVVIFRPGDWIVYLEADLKDVALGRVAEREAAEAAEEEARKREIESRFAWVGSDPDPRRAE